MIFWNPTVRAQCLYTMIMVLSVWSYHCSRFIDSWYISIIVTKVTVYRPPCISTVKDSILVRSHANRMLSHALISFLTLFAYSRAFESQNDLSCLPGVKAQVSDTSTICEDRQSYPISVYGMVNEPHVHWDQLRFATSSSDLCILGYSSDLDSHFNLDYIIWTTWIHSGNQKS